MARKKLRFVFYCLKSDVEGKIIHVFTLHKLTFAFYSWIDWLVLNVNFSNISAILWQVYSWKSDVAGTKIFTSYKVTFVFYSWKSDVEGKIINISYKLTFVFYSWKSDVEGEIINISYKLTFVFYSWKSDVEGTIIFE